MTEEHSVCARCAGMYPTCCRMDPAVAHLCFPLSEAEWERLAPFAAKAGLCGRAQETNSPEFIKAMRRLFPDRQEALTGVFSAGGVHHRLNTTQEGACVFLRSDGCSLPRTVRPWYCQLFPIWIRKGFFDRFAADECLVTREARTMDDAFAAVGLDPEDAKRLYLALCRDWGL